MTTMEFSLAHLYVCNGNGHDDLNYVRFFCQEALVRAEAAAFRLKQFATLKEWSNCIEAEVESNMAHVQAITMALSDAKSFFSLKPNIAAPIVEAASKADKICSESISDYRTVVCWLNAAKRCQKG